MKILIAGSSGFVGSSLVLYLQKQGHEISRLIHSSKPSSEKLFWNPEQGVIIGSQLEGFDAVINLAGENIADGRWTDEKKERILNSRVNATKLLSETLATLNRPPKVLINASAIGFYGNKWDIVVTEQSLKGVGFLAEVCDKWEEATSSAEHKGIRVVKLRTGMVLSATGGALSKMIFPFKFGLGATLGGGMQYISWITREDLLRVISFILEHEEINGAVNAVTPFPVTNQEFTKTLAEFFNRPARIKIPDIMVRILFGEMADEMLLSSTRALPEKLINAGFVFDDPHLKEALHHVLT